MTDQLPMFDAEPEPETGRKDYQERKQRRIEALRRRAEKLRQESEARQETADKMASVIPLGQPILVGHHSEGRDRRYRERIHDNMRKAYELRQEAEDADRRAIAAERNDAISSDDPDALDQLRAKLAKLEQKQERMKETNRLLRKGDDEGLRALGLSDGTIHELKQPDFAGRTGFADFELKNNNANIRRIRDRIKVIESKAKLQHQEIELPGDVTVVQNIAENRVQFFFPDKPDDATRALLKSHGFKWAPSVGAWQRLMNNSAIHAARYIMGKLKEQQQ